MEYIFLDESGDLGFSKRSSQFFIITILSSNNIYLLEKAVKKTHKSLRKHVKRLSGGILHAHKEKSTTRKQLLTQLLKCDVKVMTIFLEKENVYTRLKDEKHVLYNYVTNILLDRIMKKKLITHTHITLIASKRETNTFLNANFQSYLNKQTKNNHKIQLTVEIKTPAQQKALQAVDFVSWALFRKYEQKDPEYYEIIKKCIIEENGLFVDKNTKP